MTPEDYNPPGFQPTSGDDFMFEGNPVSIRVGDVNTPFHSYVPTKIFMHNYLSIWLPFFYLIFLSYRHCYEVAFMSVCF